MRPDFAAPSTVEPTPPVADAVPADDSRSVMTESDIARVLRRIAHEILEHNKGAADLVVLGIPTRGVALARRLAALIEEVEGTPVAVGALDVTMHRDDLRRQPTRSPMHTDIPPTGIDDKVVVLVDDVLYSTEVPEGVAITEAVELAKSLSTDDSPKFVNGLLGRLAEVKPTLA